MKTTHTRAGKSGYVSYVLVLSTGIVLTLLTVYFYRSTMNANVAQSTVQLQADYAEKEESILRAIVAITPNRAIRAMQHNSISSSALSEPLRWQNIFTEALVLANARNSISSELKAALNVPNLKVGNMGDSALGSPDRIFKSLGTSGYMSAGINRSLGTGFPPPLTTGNGTTISRDPLYPIISTDKQYGSLAQSGVGLPVATYPAFNVLTYPKINFGYAKPGDPFVAKRNWWAFSLNVAQHDTANTLINRPPRNMVLSIYEIPSQLAISTSAFVSLGRHASGEEWTNVNIEGGVFAGTASVEGSLNLPSLSSRHGMTISSDSRVGGQSFDKSPFAPGVREAYQLTVGDFFPVSQASESGRVAFIPINRGEEFFDRFGLAVETNVLSPTSWNNYTVGALQCAMNLDITAVNAQNMPTVLRFRAKNGNSIVEFSQPVVTGINQPLPPGYTVCAPENGSYDFGDQVVDVAYGISGKYYYESSVTGVVAFNNSRFGDPNVGSVKNGYWRPAAPFGISQIADSSLANDTTWRVELYPQRMAAFLQLIGASNTSINHSISVNVDYTTSGLNNFDFKPMTGSRRYGLVIRECSDLTSFTKGFSVVSNLRTYIADNFNIVSTTAPAGYTPGATFYPPISLFVPEKRFGVTVDPTAVRIEGQVGSLASEDQATHLLDAKGASGTSYTGSRLLVNLRPIDHPAALPPITMMNWLIVLEERKREFVGY